VLIIGMLLFTIMIGGGFLWFLLRKNPKDGISAGQSRSGSSSELTAAIAETEKTDRGWRLADIAAARRKLDPASNGGLLALSAARQVPQNAVSALDGFELRRDPTQPIPESEVQRLRNALRGCNPALTEARRIAFAPQGRFEIKFNFDKPLDTPLEQQQQSRKTAWLLAHSSELCSVDRDAAGAIEDVQATLILARYLDDEPFLISQLVRLAIQTIAISALERAMTCSVIPDDSLKSIQELLESETTGTPFVTALRGERANYHAMIECKNYQNTNLSDADYAWAIRTFHRAIETAKKGPPYYSAEWTSLVQDVQNGSAAATRLMPAFGKVRDAHTRVFANMRTAALAIAAERFRRDKGEWPTELKQLAPNYITTVPAEPYYGGPISLARPARGCSVYVKGNAAFASGEFNMIGNQPELCQGFRLLDPELRR
jgi:hypothetical protein